VIAVRTPTDRPIIPFRWVGHGVDVCVVSNEYEVRFIARDVLEAVGVEPDGWLGAQASHASFASAHADATAWSLEEARTALSPMAGTPLVREFLVWLTARAGEVDAMRKLTHESPVRPPVLLPTVDPASVEEPAPPVVDERTWSVAATARILSRDPGIRIGQQGLFDWLHLHGWIDRRSNVWLPTTLMTALGWLARLDRRVPGQHDLYPQVLITATGIHQLHQRMGGVAEIDLDRHQLMLVEDGDTE
jgi:hypothetical protein